MTTKETRLGVVQSVRPGEVTVCIQQLSACSACHAKGMCASTDCADRYVVVPTEDTSYRAGDSVLVEGDNSVGRMAVLLAFLIPIVLTLASLAIAMLAFRQSEELSALVALVVLAVYLVLLRLLNPTLGRVLRLSIRRAEGMCQSN